MISPSQLLTEVIEPVLGGLARRRSGMNSLPAVQLMLGTAAQESDMGYFLRQHPQGPARGVWQMEKATVEDLQHRYLARHANRDLYMEIAQYAVPDHSWYDQLSWNLKLACALARLRYWVVPIPIPRDLEGQARYWDVHYNANDEDEIQAYLASYEDFVTTGFL